MSSYPDKMIASPTKGNQKDKCDKKQVNIRSQNARIEKKIERKDGIAAYCINEYSGLVQFSETGKIIGTRKQYYKSRHYHRHYRLTNVEVEENADNQQYESDYADIVKRPVFQRKLFGVSRQSIPER
jgi:hypothetical protein